MITCTRTNTENEHFIQLVKLLDADLKQRDGENHFFYAQFNGIDKVKFAVVAYENNLPVGCGAIKEYSPNIMEVKRMYVLQTKRGQGIGSIILSNLEQWAVELTCTKCLLETGKKQPEAMALYKKNRYEIVSNFGQYENVENSICFEKKLL